MNYRVCHTVLTVCLVFSLICLLEPPARAYIDPGSGLLAYQTISAVIAGVIFYFRQKLHNLFHGARSSRNVEKPYL